MNLKFFPGADSFREVIENGIFYIDKTPFIREWWETGGKVTLITRPRRFGKTLNMSMLDCFFSSRYAGRGDLFEGLEIWKDEKYRALQGTLPVISVSFARVKDSTFGEAIGSICTILAELLGQQEPYLKISALSKSVQRDFYALWSSVTEKDASAAKDVIHTLSRLLSKAEEKNVVILLDEYDAPMQEAWIHGYWEEMSAFMRALFNGTFKDNPFLDRGLLTGVTRVSKESMFSDLNNLRVASVLTKGKYETAFGFTEEEVFAAMDARGFSDRQNVKKMYDGFIFGSRRDIYNPWSIINYLEGGELNQWWVNTSSNSMIDKLIKEGPSELHSSLVDLMQGKLLETELDENIVFDQLDDNPVAIWSLLVEAGYLKATLKGEGQEGRKTYEVSVTNGEVLRMFNRFVRDWFQNVKESRKDFIGGFFRGDILKMNALMNLISHRIFSVFDTGETPSPKKQPERFYHGFVLGLLVDLRGRFVISSNGESGEGRYDVMLDPIDHRKDDGFILEFKVIDAEEEKDLPDTVHSALCQIEEKQYDAKLLEKLPPERIRKYAFAFCGKNVLIDDASGVGRTAYLEKRKKRLAQASRKEPSGQA